jgi:hypothetical protein
LTAATDAGTAEGDGVELLVACGVRLETDMVDQGLRLIDGVRVDKPDGTNVPLPDALRVALPVLLALLELVAVTVTDALPERDGDRVTSDARLRPTSTGSPPAVALRPAGCQPSCWARASHRDAPPPAATASSATRFTPLSTRMLGTAPLTLAYSAHTRRGESGA